MLRPCQSCDRHVRGSDAECPFCGAHLGVDHTQPDLPRQRLARGARFAFGAAAVATTLSLGACGDGDRRPGADASTAADAGTGTDAGTAGDDAGVDAGHDAGSGTSCAAPYGAPPTDAIPQIV